MTLFLFPYGLVACSPALPQTVALALDVYGFCESAYDVSPLVLPDEAPPICPPTAVSSATFVRRIGVDEGDLPAMSVPRRPLDGFAWQYRHNATMLANAVADLQITTTAAGLTNTPSLLAQRVVLLQDLGNAVHLDPELLRAHGCAVLGQVDECTLSASECMSHLRLDQVASAIRDDPNASLPYSFDDASWAVRKRIVDDW